jgi:hypothetical protein
MTMRFLVHFLPMHLVVIVPILQAVVVVEAVVVVAPILRVVVEEEEVVEVVGPIGSSRSVVVACLRACPILPCLQVVVPILPVGHLRAIGHHSYHKIWHRGHFQRRS